MAEIIDNDLIEEIISSQFHCYDCIKWERDNHYCRIEDKKASYPECARVIAIKKILNEKIEETV